MGSKSSPPAAPDYAALAAQQGQINASTAQQQARLSNPNIISPYGTRTVQYGAPMFDQAAYDKAMLAYQSQSSQPYFNQAGYDQALANYNAGSPEVPAQG